MAAITTRQTAGGGATVAGIPLTNAQLDTNFINLNVELTGLTSSKTANTVLAAPNGVAGVPSFRTLVAADVPTLNQSTTGSAGTLLYEDNRTISPSELSSNRLKFGFTSWNNNNGTPYADFLHLRGYIDSSGGNDNLVMFRKDAIGMRIWQQTSGSATAYSTYKDVAFTDGTGATGTWGISVSGNAGTVTNGVYTNGSYADPAWITSLSKSKIGLGNVENTALSTWAGSTSITTIGATTATSLTASGLIRTTSATHSVQLGTDAGGSISLGRADNVASAPYIDFNSGATSTDFDVRLTATGGNGTAGNGLLTLSGNLSVTGNLTINGTTTTVNSTTVTVDDPIFTLGGDTAPTVDDNKDRGIEFRWHNGTVAKVGFFGFDDSTGYLTFIPDATNTSEVFSGTQGDIQATNFRGALIGNASTATNATTVTNGVYTNTNQTISGIKTFSNGIISGDTQGYPDYQFLLDFGADVAGTWRKLVTVSTTTGLYFSAGFKIEITEPQANHATTGSVNSIKEEIYYVACIRTNDTVQDTPDACYVTGPSNRIRAIKTSTGNYEIQIQNAAQYVEYRGRISVYAVNGTHTITYSNGTAPGTATATYNSTVNNSTAWFQRVGVKGQIISDVATGTAPFTVASTTRVNNLNVATAGNADTVTNGVYTNGSYANPSWITSLAETKVLPSQATHTGKFLTTNGTSTSWSTVSGGINYTRVTSAITLVDKQGVIADTSGGTFTVTLPATPAVGTQVSVVDGANWSTTNLTIARNGSTIEALAENLVLDLGGASVHLVYDGITWNVYTQIGAQGGTAVTLTGVQTLTNKTLTSPTITSPTITSPVISTISNTGTITLPTSTDTLVGRATTDTLTNKTLQSGVYTSVVDQTGSVRGGVTTVAALNIDCSLGNFFTKTIAANSTLTVSNVPASRAYAFTLEVVHTSGTITWFSGVQWPNNNTAPTLTTGKVHLFTFVTDDGGTTWRGASQINYNS